MRSAGFARHPVEGVGLLAMLVCLFGLLWSAPTRAQAEVNAAPSRFTAGARIKITTEALVANTSYRLRLEQDAPGTAEFDLLNFNSGLSTHPSVSATVPNAPNGSYALVLYRVSLGLVRVAQTAVSVAPPLALTLTPTQAAPGKAVRVQVGNLVAGSVRVSYAGQTILGPLPVGDGSWQGKFVVPRDRPASLPANVPVVVENLLGHTVSAQGSATFRALASSGAPHLGVTVSSAPGGAVDRGKPFTLAGRLQTDDGVAPDGSSHLYWRQADGTVTPLDSALTMTSDGSFSMQARAPSLFRDGYLGIGDASGSLMLVNQGVDFNTDSASDGNASFLSGPPTNLAVDGRDAGGATFTVVLRGNQPGNNDPLLEGVYVEAQQEFRDGFGAPTPNGSSPNTGNDRFAFCAFRPNQLSAANSSSFQSINRENYGCDVTMFRKRSNVNGEVTFSINPDTIRDTNVMGVIEDCFRNGPCRGEEVGHRPAGTTSGLPGGLISFNMMVYSAHLGYRSAGVTIGYDGDTGQFYNVNSGAAFVNNRTEVLLERSENSDVDLRDLQIDGLGKPQSHTQGCQNLPECYYEPFIFGSVSNGDTVNGQISRAMYTYPNSSKWPNAVFDTRNNGRKMRLSVDPAVSGTLTSGKVTLDGFPPIFFAQSNAPATCVLDQTTLLEYVAILPDLTRVAAGGLHGTVELVFGANALPPKPFVILTQTPPNHIDATNPNIVASSLRIDALNDTVRGSFNVPDMDIPVSSPGYGLGRLDNVSENVSDFTFTQTPDAIAADRLTAVSNNDVAGKAGGPKAADGVYFGFTDFHHDTPDPVVLFDTGVIPLFRYTWGLEPIAGATLGADFWMASDLAYYGQLRTGGMNATIDPRLNGGVDLFFDLDVLFGLVSASVGAETDLGLTMRTVVGAGGLPNQNSGQCFTFDIIMHWEACAVGICDGGTQPLVQVANGSSCPGNAPNGISYQRTNLLPDPANFDLPRPQHTATALATDGRGNSISVGVNSAGALIATHLSGGTSSAVRTIATGTVGVQHIDVAFYASNRAMAVWSENTRTASQLRSLIQTQRERAFDDMARTQRLRFAYWDGRAWSSPAELTTVGSDGKPRLAGCIPPPRFLTSACPSGGEITAVWEHDANANLDAPDIEIWSAQWTPGGHGWSTPSRVSNSGVSSDMLPVVAYAGSVPLVVWAYNPAGHFASLGGRRVMYRFLDGSSAARIATALGFGVGWVSLGINPDGQPVIAYTLAQDTQGFVGNRQALSVAIGTCSSGACTFDVTEPRDGNGRQYRIERPNVMFDDDGTPIIGFRALAFGANTAGTVGLPGDPPGILLGTGEVAMLRVSSFNQAQIATQLVPLTNDGLQHWKPQLVYDETIGGVLAVSMDAPPPVGTAAPLRMAQAFSPQTTAITLAGTALGDGSVMHTRGAGPDFSLRDPVLSRSVVSGGQSLNLAVKLVNQGQAFDPAVHGSLRVVASWNAPAGAGVQAGSYTLIQTQASNAQRALNISLSVPAGVNSDERQTLFIDIVADENANEVGGSADRLQAVLNVMPVPKHVNVDTRTDSSLVNLSWDAVSDTRVKGWRVWRLAADGSWTHIGSTRVPGFLDAFGRIGEEMHYRVAAYSANGMESEPSAAAAGTIETRLPDGLFRNGFEDAP